MFTRRFHPGSRRPPRVFANPADAPARQTLQVGGILPVAAALALLTLGLPATSSAQALGTMQVAARVVPASVGWTGLAEAKVAARGLSAAQPGQTFVRRGRLVQTTAEIRPSGSRHVLLITIQHPHN